MTTALTYTPGRRLHRWALLTGAVTFAQLALGAVVTSFHVGMADRVWPTLPWHLFLISWQEPSAGYLIEHTHRLTGHLVGLCAIVLAVGAWVGEPRLWLRGLGLAAVLALVVSLAACFAFLDRTEQALTVTEGRLCLLCLGVCLAAVLGLFAVALALRDPGLWVRWLGTLVLAGVIVQGLLGGFRVKLNALAGPNLALVHGCFAQVVFALLVGMAAVTARRPALRAPAAAPLRRWAALAVGLVLVQIVLGALVRHTHSPLWGRGHLLAAFAVVAAVVLLVRLVFENRGKDGQTAGFAVLLAALVAVQLLLGVEAWMVKFSSGELPELVQVTVPRALTRTAHVLAGSAILATAVTLAVRVRRRPAVAVGVAPAAAPLGGAA
jgi:heme A synthase